LEVDLAQKPALGKGLASLFPGLNPGAAGAAIPPKPPSLQPGQTGAGAVAAGMAVPVAPGTVVLPEVANKDRHPGISLAYVEEIRANDYQPRREFDEKTLEELAQSIRENGVIQPLVVRKGSTGYQLIAGERRLRAAKLAGLKQVPIVIRRSTDREALELALVENIQRQDLGCIDEALAYQQLMEEFNLTQEEVAHRVGKDRATVANYIRLLKLPHAIIDDLKRGILSFGHGKAILGLEENDQRLLARAEIVEKKLSVRAAEALGEQMKQKTVPTSDTASASEIASPTASRLATLANDLTRAWSTRVELKGSERRGKILIHYGSRQELDRILESLQNQKV
jgi:ParB family chromosome partitioning protein